MTVINNIVTLDNERKAHISHFEKFDDLPEEKKRLALAATKGKVPYYCADIIRVFVCSDEGKAVLDAAFDSYHKEQAEKESADAAVIEKEIAELKAKGNLIVVATKELFNDGDGWIEYEATLEDGRKIHATPSRTIHGVKFVAAEQATPETEESARKIVVRNEAFEAAKIENAKKAKIENAKAIIECRTVFKNYKEQQAWIKSYNNLHNEGGEGYVPLSVTVDQVERARNFLEANH